MAWDGYISNLMAGDFVMDAAIVGHEPGQESVWAAHPGGDFSRIMPSEIRRLLIKDRGELLSAGLTLANVKCTVLRDRLNEDGEYTMDLRTKATDQQPETFNISVGKTQKAMVLVKGNKNAHGGTLNPRVHSMAKYLRECQF